MSEQNLESGLPASSAPAGQSVAAEPGNVQQTSTENMVTVPASTLERLEQSVKALQSDKDRAAQRNANRLDGVDEQLNRMAQLIGDGLTPAQAKREMQVDAILASGLPPQPQQPTAQQPLSPPSGQGQSAPDVSAIVKAFDLQQSDPDVARAMFNSGGNVAKLQSDLLNIKIARQSSPAAQPNQAAAPPAQAPQGVTSDDQAALRQAYEAELKTMPGKVRQITNLKLKYRGLGMVD